MAGTIRIGSRGSQLALWQANWAKACLSDRFPECRVEITVIRTQGDRLSETPLSQMGGKEVWTKEIEKALLENQIDLAVHTLGAVSKREDVRDALVSRRGEKFIDLGKNARIATSSLRRQAQLLHARPDFKIESIRGNVDTRLRKLHEEGLDAIILAAAGLIRLGLRDQITECLDPIVCVPAPGQAALGIETRQKDDRVAAFVEVLNDVDAFRDVGAEREMLRTLEGGCRVPIGAWARVEAGEFRLTGMVATPDGQCVIRESLVGDPDNPQDLGRAMAKKLIGLGADDILANLEELG